MSRVCGPLAFRLHARLIRSVGCMNQRVQKKGMSIKQLALINNRLAKLINKYSVVVQREKLI